MGIGRGGIAGRGGGSGNEKSKGGTTWGERDREKEREREGERNTDVTSWKGGDWEWNGRGVSSCFWNCSIATSDVLRHE